MNDQVYKTIELTGSSEQGFQQAIQRALAKAHETVRHIRWFQVRDTRGEARDGRIAPWQVTVTIGFTLADQY